MSLLCSKPSRDFLCPPDTVNHIVKPFPFWVLPTFPLHFTPISASKIYAPSMQKLCPLLLSAPDPLKMYFLSLELLFSSSPKLTPMSCLLTDYNLHQLLILTSLSSTEKSLAQNLHCGLAIPPTAPRIYSDPSNQNPDHHGPSDSRLRPKLLQDKTRSSFIFVTLGPGVE